MRTWDNLINPGTAAILCAVIFGSLFIVLCKYINVASDHFESLATESKPKKKKYKIYDLQNQEDRKLFAESLVNDTFALIKINDTYKASFSDLFHIFDKLFSSNESLQCELHEKYIGYTSTENVKQSLWFHLDYDKKTLFPVLKNKHKSLLYKHNNHEKVINAFNHYNKIANDAMTAFLENQCKDKKSYIECWNNLFPKNKTIEEKNNDDLHETKQNDSYPECDIYHKYRKSHNLSLNNIAAIQYYGNKEKLEFNCEEHMDYTLITLVTANEPGLQVRDLMYFEWIDVYDIIKSNNMEIKDVIIVMTGLTGGTLLNDTVPCYHAVKKQSYKTHRISFPLFCYADPNGIIDSSLIKSNIDSKTNSKQSDHKKIDCAQYLTQNMYSSDVNF